MMMVDLSTLPETRRGHATRRAGRRGARGVAEDPLMECEIIRQTRTDKQTTNQGGKVQGIKKDFN